MDYFIKYKKLNKNSEYPVLITLGFSHERDIDQFQPIESDIVKNHIQLLKLTYEFIKQMKVQDGIDIK